ncbi:GNAT family N-acetyltransferase [Oceanobacillus longus]|uniref:GNAT family N-acetyltransferase n=1 Tax=Oceanobacillus longus TaxID=930120 RepID=A0ABV8GYJ9_9BACI
MNVLIRKAEENDVPHLARLMGELGYPTTIEEMEARFSNINASPFYHTFVAEVNGIVAGMIGMIWSHHYEKNDDYVRIVAFVVDSNYRKQGVGKKLLLETEVWAKEKRDSKACFEQWKPR